MEVYANAYACVLPENEMYCKVTQLKLNCVTEIQCAKCVAENIMSLPSN